MHVSFLCLLCAASLAVFPSVASSYLPAPPQPAALARKNQFASNPKINPFAKRQATRKQIMQRQLARERPAPRDIADVAVVAIGKQRMVEREAPSPSPNAGDAPSDSQFYLEYCGSGTGADSQYAALNTASDGSETYLLPVISRSSASAFFLSSSGNLVSSSNGVLADQSTDVDTLSFDSPSVIGQNSYSRPSFTIDSGKLVAQGSNIAFNLCPATTNTAASSLMGSNILHLSSPASIGLGCSTVTLSIIYV